MMLKLTRRRIKDAFGGDLIGHGSYTGDPDGGFDLAEGTDMYFLPAQIDLPPQQGPFSPKSSWSQPQ